jgi:hypothetical protein
MQYSTVALATCGIGTIEVAQLLPTEAARARMHPLAALLVVKAALIAAAYSTTLQ